VEVRAHQVITVQSHLLYQSQHPRVHSLKALVMCNRRFVSLESSLLRVLAPSVCLALLVISALRMESGSKRSVHLVNTGRWTIRSLARCVSQERGVPSTLSQMLRSARRAQQVVFAHSKV